MAFLKNGLEMQKARTSESFIPIQTHITEQIVSTHEREYLQVIRFSGASFESADDEQLNNWHERLNVLWRSLASPHLALWQHIVRRSGNTYPTGEFKAGFAQDLNRKYADRVCNELLMFNELYVTLIYKPQASRLEKGLIKLFSAVDSQAIEQERLEAVEVLSKLASEVLSSLKRYEPERLGIYCHKGVLFSEVFEFFGFLVNGEWQRIPVGRFVASEMIQTSRPFLGRETLELRMPTDTLWGAVLGIKEYPAETHTGFLNGLLALPCEFVLTQSFAFLAKDTAKHKLKIARNRMINAGDDAQTQIEEIEEALDDLQSNRFVMGEHHFNLLVKADTIKALQDHVSLARAVLSDAGVVVAREDLALEAAFWAQLPANFKLRPRVAAIHSRNLAGFAPLHNFPIGRKTGNHWGDALTLFVTASGTPYYFSYHASDPNDPDGGTKKDVGHTLILGPTGSGKTAFIAFTLCMLQKMQVTSVLFTKDRDMEICIRAIGGTYYPIQLGVKTGWNPFSLDATPTTIQFLIDLVKKLVEDPSQPLSILEENDIVEAVKAVMAFEPQDRRLGRVLDYLNTKKQAGVYTRLKKWCYPRKQGDSEGTYAWVFDHTIDTLATSFQKACTIGFDITEFLDKPELRTPINMYLFHLVNQLIDGRRFALFISEFWKALSDEYFATFAKDQLKTIRKNNGFVVLDSQSPSDALNHPISRTLIEQTPTKILFPNPDARYEEYTEGGLNLSEREYQLIKHDIPEGARQFLIKQGHHTVVAKLDLKGFDEELAVLSSRKSNIERVEQLIKEYGEQPDQWLTFFRKQRPSA